MELKKTGNWSLLRYGNKKQGFIYWVVSLPYRETCLSFSTLNKAKEYFNLAIKECA